MDISPQYLAGVIDSDGSISITKRHVNRPNPHYSVMIQLGWIYKEETEEFMKALVNKFGGSYKVIEPTVKSFTKKQSVKYCAFGDAAENILKEIKPFLILKSKQADNALELRCVVRSYSGQRRPDDCGSKLEQLWKSNAVLNDKNGVEA